jgi:nucleolar protein 14
MQRRNKVGGIMDRRFGENDPTMAPEEKMLERFTQEKQRRHKNSSAFDLEEDGEGELTHMGQSLSLDGPTLTDDFDEEGLTLSDAEDHAADAESSPYKRRRDLGLEDSDREDDELDGQPERKKTKQEVMKEVIAKSKLHKYERQAAKDEDDDLREELDKEMGELHALLRGGIRRPTAAKPLDVPGMNPERAALLAGSDKIKFDKEYDLRLRQMAQDKKSKPTERSKTEDEKLAEQSRRLQELEARRIRRMQGEPDSEDVEREHETKVSLGEGDGDGEDDFGLGSGIRARNSQNAQEELAVEDEDDFIIDDDLVASGSDLDTSDEDSLSEEDDDAVVGDDSEFLDGLLTKEESSRPEFLTGANGPLQEMELEDANGVNGDLAYTFACPQSHDELLDITKGVVVEDLPTVVRRIRALYHPKLKSENKAKLGHFTVALVDHVHHLANLSPPAPFDILEALVRHIHSLAKTFPVEVANAFRKHLKNWNDLRALMPSAGDLVLLAAIGNIFPTSDHFHQVVTPAMLCMGRYMGQRIPHTLTEYATGLFITTLCLQYQRLSKRFVPEVVGFLLNTLCALSPTKPASIPGSFPYHEAKLTRLEGAHDVLVRRLRLVDIINGVSDVDGEKTIKVGLMDTSIKLLDAAADLWNGKSAFEEVFNPALKILRHLGGKSCHVELPENIQVINISNIMCPIC